MGGETQSAADGRRRSGVSEIREVRGMITAIRLAAERILVDAGYRNTIFGNGTIWLPSSYDADWLKEGRQCVFVFRRRQRRDSGGVYSPAHGVGICTYHHQEHCGGYWGSEHKLLDLIGSPEAAVCAAAAIGRDRGVPVCLEVATVCHALADLGLWCEEPVGGGD
jgi:hypothetical protein